jgi:hypothetical protein
MSLEAHIRELETKHQKLEDQIADMMNHPSVDDLEIKRLKLEKLHIKEEIERLRKQLDAA